MALVAQGLLRQNEISAALKRAEKALAPHVVRIRYEVGQDWSGDDAVFVRIVLSDEASRESNLRIITPRVVAAILSEIDFDELGLLAYYNFRSVSEQAQMREPQWA